MDITVEVELINQQDNEVSIELPIGTVIEVGDTTVQNVALASKYKFRLGPNSTTRVKVIGVCLNRNLSTPHLTPGVMTPFRFDSDTIDQDRVWDRVSYPTSY